MSCCAAVATSVESTTKRKASPLPQLIVYTMSTFVFGMTCSALGPTIPWLAAQAGVTAESLGWLPAAQCVTCIVSGLASSVMGKVPRRYHHWVLCCLNLWLGTGFALLPIASTSLVNLTALFGLQVIPRPWIGQITNLLVSELYEDASKSSMAQSINQGGFALGCVATLLLDFLCQHSIGSANFFYLAACFPFMAGLLFCLLPSLSDANIPEGTSLSGTASSQVPSLFTVLCALLGVLAVGIEVACGTWLITSMTEIDFSSGEATMTNIIFWLLFAASRLLIAPFIVWLFGTEPAQVVIGGALLAMVFCMPASVWPHSWKYVAGAVSAVAVGAGPAYAMTITMAKARGQLSSADSALFSVAASLGAGGVPFFVSKILSTFGPRSFFPALEAMAVAMLAFPVLLTRLLPKALPHTLQERFLDNQLLDSIQKQ